MLYRGVPIRIVLTLTTVSKAITGGFGIRLKRFFVDFAMVFSNGTTFYQPYVVSDGPSPIVDLDNKTTSGLLTAGFTF